MFLLGLPDDERLKRGEVVWEPGEPCCQQARVLQLCTQELNRIRQPRAAEEFFVNAGENVLRWQVIDEAIAERAEEIRLLYVLFALQHGGSTHSTSIHR